MSRMSLAIVQEGKPREYLFALWEQSTVGSESSLVDVVRDVVEKRLEARCFGDLGYFSHREPAYDKEELDPESEIEEEKSRVFQMLPRNKLESFCSKVYSSFGTSKASLKKQVEKFVKGAEFDEASHTASTWLKEILIKLEPVVKEHLSRVLLPEMVEDDVRRGNMLKNLSQVVLVRFVRRWVVAANYDVGKSVAVERIPNLTPSKIEAIVASVKPSIPRDDVSRFASLVFASPENRDKATAYVRLLETFVRTKVLLPIMVGCAEEDMAKQVLKTASFRLHSELRKNEHAALYEELVNLLFDLRQEGAQVVTKAMLKWGDGYVLRTLIADHVLDAILESSQKEKGEGTSITEEARKEADSWVRKDNTRRAVVYIAGFQARQAEKAANRFSSEFASAVRDAFCLSDDEELEDWAIGYQFINDRDKGGLRKPSVRFVKIVAEIWKYLYLIARGSTGWDSGNVWLRTLNSITSSESGVKERFDKFWSDEVGISSLFSEETIRLRNIVFENLTRHASRAWTRRQARLKVQFEHDAHDPDIPTRQAVATAIHVAKTSGERKRQKKNQSNKSRVKRKI